MSDPTVQETKATRLMVLYRLRAEGKLTGLSDIELGRAFGIRRETAWKDRRALETTDRLYTAVAAKLAAE